MGECSKSDRDVSRGHMSQPERNACQQKLDRFRASKQRATMWLKHMEYVQIPEFTMIVKNQNRQDPQGWISGPP